MSKISKSFAYAFKGIARSISSERNLKIELGFAFFAIIMCIVLRCTFAEWAIVVALIGAVLCAELFNTAIEHAVDLVSPEQNDKAMFAKDAAAGAVLVISIAAAVVGIIIFTVAGIRLL